MYLNLDLKYVDETTSNNEDEVLRQIIELNNLTLFEGVKYDSIKMIVVEAERTREVINCGNTNDPKMCNRIMKHPCGKNSSLDFVIWDSEGIMHFLELKTTTAKLKTNTFSLGSNKRDIDLILFDYKTFVFLSKINNDKLIVTADQIKSKYKNWNKFIVELKKEMDKNSRNIKMINNKYLSNPEETILPRLRLFLDFKYNPTYGLLYNEAVEEIE